ncbi:tbc domain-containing protein [Cystoisospora suis]|uniref:Tbc domain-containing protein n=1 Tax=Cystoisospora suis TaxID=483139 RepID=A0A2C6L5X8_9APIC|nr:tbc domain-containing protein [Cystoisospora suis]
MCAAVSTAYLIPSSSSPCSSPRDVGSRNEDEDWESRRERHEKKKDISPSSSCTVKENGDAVFLHEATSYGVHTPDVALPLSFHRREESRETDERGREECLCGDFSSLRRERLTRDTGSSSSSFHFTRSSSDFCLSSSSSSSISKANVVRFSSLSSSSFPEAGEGVFFQKRVTLSSSLPLSFHRHSHLLSSPSVVMEEGGKEDAEEKKKKASSVLSSSFSPSFSLRADLSVDKDQEMEKINGREREEEERRRSLRDILKVSRDMLDGRFPVRPLKKEKGREDEEEREGLEEEECRERSFLSVNEEEGEKEKEDEKKEKQEEQMLVLDEEEGEDMKSVEEGEEREEGDLPASCVEEEKVVKEERREDDTEEEEEEKKEKCFLWISRDELKEGREKKKFETFRLEKPHFIEGGGRGGKLNYRQRQSLSFSEDYSSSSLFCSSSSSSSFPTPSMMASTADHISFSSSLPSSFSFSVSPCFSAESSSSSSSSCFAYPLFRSSSKESEIPLGPSSSLRRSFSSPVFSSSFSSSSPPPPLPRVSSVSSPCFPSSPASALPIRTPPTCSSSISPPCFLSSSSSSSSSSPSPCPSSSPSPLPSSSSCSPPPLLSSSPSPPPPLPSSSPPPPRLPSSSLPSSSFASSPPAEDLLTKLPVSVLSRLACEFLSFFDVVRLSQVSKFLLRLSQKQQWLRRQILAGALHTLFVSSSSLSPPPLLRPSPSPSLHSSSYSSNEKVSPLRPDRNAFLSSPLTQHAKEENEEKKQAKQKKTKRGEEEQVSCPSSSSSSSSCACTCHNDEDLDDEAEMGEENSLSILVEEEEEKKKKKTDEENEEGELGEPVYRRESYRCGCCSKDDYDGGGVDARRLRRRCWLFARGRVDCLSLQIAKELQWISLSSFSSSSLSSSCLHSQRRTDSKRRMKKSDTEEEDDVDEVSMNRASREKDREKDEDNDEGDSEGGRRTRSDARSEAEEEEYDERGTGGVWDKEILREREYEEENKKNELVAVARGREESLRHKEEEKRKVEDRSDKIPADSSLHERNEEEEERKEKKEAATVDKEVMDSCIYPYPFMPHINFDAVYSRYSSSSSSFGSLLKTAGSFSSSSFNRGEETGTKTSRQEAPSKEEEKDGRRRRRRRERKDSRREEGGEEEEELLPWPCAEVYSYLRECRLDESRADEIKRDVPRTFPHHA